MTKSIDELLKTERNVTYFFALGAGQCFVVEMLFVCYRVCVCVFECGLFYVACMITHTPIDSHTHLHRHIVCMQTCTLLLHRHTHALHIHMYMCTILVHINFHEYT